MPDRVYFLPQPDSFCFSEGRDRWVRVALQLVQRRKRRFHGGGQRPAPACQPEPPHVFLQHGERIGCSLEQRLCGLAPLQGPTILTEQRNDRCRYWISFRGIAVAPCKKFF